MDILRALRLKSLLYLPMGVPSTYKHRFHIPIMDGIQALIPAASCLIPSY